MPSAIRVFLFASLAANLFFAGWFFGGLWFAPPFGPPGSGLQPLVERVERSVSTEGFAKVGPALREIDDLFRAGGEDMRRRMDEASKLAEAEPFDAQKLEAVLAEMPNGRQEGERQIARLMASVLSQLSLQDRIAVTDALFRRPPPPPGPPPGPLPPR